MKQVKPHLTSCLMISKNAINILTNLAEQESIDAARLLGIANKKRSQDTEQLRLLEDYRSGYMAQFYEQSSQGFALTGYSNFYHFLRNLEKAIDQQNQVLQSSICSAVKALADWQSSERKRLSFNTLTKRAQIIAVREENKRDQKQIDEYATRKYSTQR